MNSYDQLSKRQRMYVDAIIESAPTLSIDIEKTEFSRAELRQVSMTSKGKIWIPNWITHDASRRTGRGIFSIPEVMDAGTVAVSPGHETEGDTEQDQVHIEEVHTEEVQVEETVNA